MNPAHSPTSRRDTGHSDRTDEQPLASPTSDPFSPLSLPGLRSFLGGLAVLAFSGGGFSQEPPKKGDKPATGVPSSGPIQDSRVIPSDLRIPATSIPVVSPAPDAVTITKSVLKKEFNVELAGELTHVRSKNIAFHYVIPQETVADQEKETNEAFVKGMEAHLGHHASLIFGDKEVRLLSPLDVFIISDATATITVPGIGPRTAMYSGQQSVADPKKFKLQVAGFVFENEDQFTRSFRHEIWHALVRNRFGPDKPLTLPLDEGIASALEPGSYKKTIETLSDKKNAEHLKTYASLSRILASTTDAGKTNGEIRVAYAMRCLLIQFLIDFKREGDEKLPEPASLERGWRRIGALLDEMNSTDLITMPLTGTTAKKYNTVFKTIYGLDVNALDAKFQTYCDMVLKPQP